MPSTTMPLVKSQVSPSMPNSDLAVPSSTPFLMKNRIQPYSRTFSDTNSGMVNSSVSSVDQRPNTRASPYAIG